MSEHIKLWPEQYVNRVVQKHVVEIAELKGEMQALKAILKGLATPKRGRPPKVEPEAE